MNLLINVDETLELRLIWGHFQTDPSESVLNRDKRDRMGKRKPTWIILDTWRMMSKWEMLGAITNKHGDDYETKNGDDPGHRWRSRQVCGETKGTKGVDPLDDDGWISRSNKKIGLDGGSWSFSKKPQIQPAIFDYQSVYSVYPTRHPYLCCSSSRVCR